MALTLSGTSGVLDNSGAFIAGTAVASTSGTSIDFTSIPSWVKRVTVMFNSVSTTSSGDYYIQIGSGSVTTSGYSNVRGYVNGSSASASSPTSAAIIAIARNNATVLTTGQAVLTLIGSNVWVASSVMGEVGGSLVTWSSGNSGTLSGALDRVRITTSSGSETFDAGTINIFYE
jgi:hypothetical protein